MVNRGQEGTENDVDLEEWGHLVSGGMMAETPYMVETVIITNV